MTAGWLLVLAALLLPGVAVADTVSRFVIAGQELEVPIGEDFCAATGADMRDTALSRILGHPMVARTRPLALHLDCAGLAELRAGGTPESLRARYWSLVNTSPGDLQFTANHLATYEAMLIGLSSPKARELFGRNLVTGASKKDFKPSSITVEVHQRAIGGTVLAEVDALDRLYDLEMGLALLPVRSRLILTTTVETAGASDGGADFAQAFAMLTEIREAP